MSLSRMSSWVNLLVKIAGGIAVSLLPRSLSVTGRRSLKSAAEMDEMLAFETVNVRIESMSIHVTSAQSDLEVSAARMASRIAAWRSQTLTNACASAVRCVPTSIVVAKATNEVANTATTARNRECMAARLGLGAGCPFGMLLLGIGYSEHDGEPPGIKGKT